MKKILTLMILALLGIGPLMAQGTSTYLKGDVDGDGSVGIGDVTVMIDYLLDGDASRINEPNTEVNGDGSITIDDVTCLIDYLLSGSWPSPAAPATEEFTVNGVTFTMVTVEGGTFQMGATAEQGTTDPQEDEYPVHEVTLSTYSIGQTEVTQELWKAVMITCYDSTFFDYEEWVEPSYFSAYNGFEENLQRPVERVNFTRINAFLWQLKRLTGREFSLPTEAEWEFAARGGNLSKGYKYAGSNDINEVAWYAGNSFHVDEDSPDYGTHTVATKAPNELGLYDMSGNVQERCLDGYKEYPSEPQTNPYCSPDISSAIIGRGGAWTLIPRASRVSCRFFYPHYGSKNAGFRLVLRSAPLNDTGNTSKQ